MAYYYKPHKNVIKNPPYVKITTHAAWNCGGKYGPAVLRKEKVIHDGKNNVFKIQFTEEGEDEETNKIHTLEMTREEVNQLISELVNSLDYKWEITQ